MRQKLTRKKGWMAGFAALLLAGCAGMPSMAPRFNGVWVATPESTSWVEIQAHSVVSFGLTLSNGHCASTPIEILATNRVDAPVSAIGNGPMSLKLDGGTLVISGKLGTTRFVPAPRESICLGRGGVYAPGAPYPKTR